MGGTVASAGLHRGCLARCWGGKFGNQGLLIATAGAVAKDAENCALACRPVIQRRIDVSALSAAAGLSAGWGSSGASMR